MNDSTPRLGIDIGRVIIDGPRNRQEDTGFFDGDEAALLATPEVPGAFAAIGRLALLFGSGNVWLVSKCGERVQERTLHWLDGHNFWASTQIRRPHAWFCRQRPEKRDICLKLGITHFVDDRTDVMRAIGRAVPHRYLFGPHNRYVVPNGVTAVSNWEYTEEAIRQDYPIERKGS